MSLFILIFMSNEIIINEIMSKWEIKKQKVDDMEVTYDYALVLMGQPNRVSQAMQMYKNGKVKNICLLGRQPYRDYKSKIIKLGIPAAHLFVENKSRNTYEHAYYFRDFMTSVQPQCLDTASFIMITSAYHMRRAIKCFDKQEISVVHFGMNYLSYEADHYDLLDMLPSPIALYYWKVLIKEWFGIAGYKVMGYI